MIVTVTFNPAIDKTARIDALCPHGLNRLGQVEQDVGGKGVNVSKMLAALGQDSVACGFAAGQAGRQVVETLRAWPGGHITPDFVSIPGETRTNLKLVEPDGALTELNESGPAASPAHLETLTRTLLGHAGPGTLFVLAGSIGPGVPEEIYRTLTLRLRAAGARVLADADGPLFARAVQAAPDVVKPNAFELCQYFGVETTDAVDELAAMGRALTEQGVGLVCISMGSRGACFVQGQTAWYAPALPIVPASTVGAGDAMLAGVACGMDRRLPLEGCLKLGMAASAAACTTPGTRPPELAAVEALLPGAALQQCGKSL
ncbi:MAG TPA: 1-phosphofructokinase family hexose kinase [Candidatus Gemmiger faecigallinarum]|nr:1-phosphofructokinase family hexose kinase [Candidatus Gemmiger faecigallinarum]